MQRLSIAAIHRRIGNHAWLKSRGDEESRGVAGGIGDFRLSRPVWRLHIIGDLSPKHHNDAR